MKLTQIADQTARAALLTFGLFGAWILGGSGVAIAATGLLPEDPTTIAEPEALEVVETLEECLNRGRRADGTISAATQTRCALNTATASPSSIETPNTTFPDHQSSVEVSDAGAWKVLASLIEGQRSTIYDDNGAIEAQVTL
jgi:hypothetical protein